MSSDSKSSRNLSCEKEIPALQYEQIRGRIWDICPTSTGSSGEQWDKWKAVITLRAL